MNAKIVAILIFVLIVVVSVMFNFEATIIPTWITSTINKVRNPADLHEPIVEDDFEFWNQGYAKKYELTPKYSDFYAIGIQCDGAYIPSGYRQKNKYEFKGRLKVNFYHKDKLLTSQEISGFKTMGYMKGDIHHISKIEFTIFEIPLLGKYKKDISAKITVIEPDSYLKEFKDSIKLFVAVSTTP